jgi:hypothetical protein
MTTEIVEFLNARLDEDEFALRMRSYRAYAGAVTCSCGDQGWIAGMHWSGDGDEMTISVRHEPGGTTHVIERAAATSLLESLPLTAESKRSVAEVKAKRGILSLHQSVPDEFHGHPACGTCHWDELRGSTSSWPCRTVLALTAVYADHPDYEPQWRL